MMFGFTWKLTSSFLNISARTSSGSPLNIAWTNGGWNEEKQTLEYNSIAVFSSTCVVFWYIPQTQDEDKNQTFQAVKSRNQRQYLELKEL